MIKEMKHYVLKALLLLVLVGSGFLPSATAASEITIRPFLIDETLAPRDTVQKLITIKSDYTYRKAVLYATVNEISVDNQGEIKQFITPVMTDRTNTVTSWIEISRGRIEVPQQESREVPLTIRVHPYAEPGEYHVFIGLVEAPNRPTAEAKALAGDADGVIVKITIADKRSDSMRVAGFVIDRFVTGDDKRDINIEVENTGDIESVPKGEIVFYDSRGLEVSSVLVNAEGVSVPAGATQVIKASIPLKDGLGRFKANLTLKYGQNQTASLQDTTFFYLMPLHLLLLVFFGVLLSALFVVLLFRHVFFSHEEEDGVDEVTMYVKEGHEAKPQDHDIDLKNNN